MNKDTFRTWLASAEYTYNETQCDALLAFADQANICVMLLDEEAHVCFINPVASNLLSLDSDSIDNSLRFLDYFSCIEIETTPKLGFITATLSSESEGKFFWTVGRLISGKDQMSHGGYILTGRSHVTDPVQRSLGTLKHFVRQLPANVYLKNESGVIIYANDELARVAGYTTSDDIIGKTDHDLIWHESGETFRQNDQRVLDDHERHIFEERAIIATGESRTFLSTKAPYYDDQSHIQGVMGISVDITELKKETRQLTYEKKRVELEQAKTEVFLKNIVRCLPGMIYWKDRSGVILGCNDRLASIAGFEHAEAIIGKTDNDFAWRDAAKKVRENDLEVMTSKQMHTFEESGRTAEGVMGTFLTLKSPLLEKDGSVSGVLGISIDITERKNVERALMQAKVDAEAANQAKSQFISSLGHEFRTPLNNIISLSEILRNPRYKALKKSEQGKYLDAINDSGRQLLKLIDDVIAYSRLNIAEFKIYMEKCDLRDILEKVYRANVHRVEDGRVRLLFNYPKRVPIYVLGDEQRLRQVFTNLLDNAIKFTRKGKIRISVNHELSKNAVRVKVHDTGIGIQPDKLETIFERFSQAHSTDEDNRLGRYRGIGLGLSIVRELVKLMKGNITVNSVYGKHTTFEIVLPCYKSESVYE